MIDLAGSERFAKTNATPQQLKEANSINKSLSGKLIKIKRHGKTALKGCSFINQLLDLPINSISTNSFWRAKSKWLHQGHVGDEF